MYIKLWGTRGSLPCSGPETIEYGGETPCVELREAEEDDHIFVLDAGSGIRKLGMNSKNIKRADILLTHLHLDHIQGLGFFAPLMNPKVEVHIYGPAGHSDELHALLTKYLSPPLFPVLLRDLPCKLHIHAVGSSNFNIGNLNIFSEFVCHPGPTVGYRISTDRATIAYISDHEPALGAKRFPINADWTSGYNIAKEVDLLLHDAQYTRDEYNSRAGWGHSTIHDALEFAKLAKVKAFVSFHHDPAHSDQELDKILASAVNNVKPEFKIYAGREGREFRF